MEKLEDKINTNEKLLEEEQIDVPIMERKPMNISGEAEKNEEELKKIAPASTEPLKTKNASKKWLVALLFIAVNILAILLTAIMEFIGDEHPINISKVWGTFMENWVWGIAAIALIALCLSFESLKRFLLLKTTLKKKLPLTSLNAVIITKYYDNITPLGAGGQPFEIYYLRKKGLPIGIASGVPLVSYSLNKIAYVFVSLFAILINGFGDVSLFIKILCVIGLVTNLTIPAAIIMFALMPKFSSAVAKGVAFIAKKLHLIKDKDAFVKKMTGSFIEYADCINYFLKKSKISIIVAFLCSIFYYLAFYSLPFVTIHLSGNHNVAWNEMFTYCVICYASITLLPTPGGSGGAELSFRSIFSNYLSGGTVFWGMLAWRIFSYYSFIIFGLILIISQQIAKFTKQIVTEDKKEKVHPVIIEPEDELEPYSPIPPTVATAEDDIDTAVPLSVAEATLEPEVEELTAEEIEITYDNVETVAEFTAVIQSKSTVTITEEKIEHVDHTNEPHQITIGEVLGMEAMHTPTENDDKASEIHQVDEHHHSENQIGIHELDFKTQEEPATISQEKSLDTEKLISEEELAQTQAQSIQDCDKEQSDISLPIEYADQGETVKQSEEIALNDNLQQKKEEPKE